MSPDSNASPPNLEFYRKQAKALLKAIRSTDPTALARIRVHLPHFTPDHVFLLSDAQWILAREHGFASWPKFKQHIESLIVSPSPASPETGGVLPVQTTENLHMEIKTAQWIRTHTSWAREDGENDFTFRNQEWIRLYPAAYAWRNESDDSWTQDVIDEHGHFHTASTWRVCNFDPRPQPKLARSVLNQVLFPPLPEDGSPEESLSERHERGDWQHGLMELDGQALIRWYHETIQDNYQVAVTIWTEPETQRIVRKERHEMDLLTEKPASLEVCEQYLYNAEIPEETFQMPPGKRIVNTGGKK